MIKYHMSRRTFAGAGLASAGLVLSSSARAFADKVPTAESALGPFYPIARPADADADLTWVKGHDKRALGQVIEISGRVFDVKGNTVPGATLELWQANAAGRYDHPSDPAIAPLDPNFQGYANIRSDSKGEWRLVTIKPGGYDSPIGHRPPHIHFDFRSEKSRNIAQLYFPEEAEGNAKDMLYKQLSPAEAATSLAVRDANDSNKYTWDIVLLV
jgi:protocatechuate 3,4-dioxygenase beta subunit